MEPEFRRLAEKMIFTTTKPDASSHDCVLVAGKKYAATYNTGDHSSFQLEQKMILYNLIDPTLQIEVSVWQIKLNSIIFKTTGDSSFEHIPEETDDDSPPLEYYLLGINQETRTPEWKEGQLLERDNFGYAFGNTDGSPGNALFDYWGHVVGFALSSQVIQGDKQLAIVLTVHFLGYGRKRTYAISDSESESESDTEHNHQSNSDTESDTE